MALKRGEFTSLHATPFIVLVYIFKVAISFAFVYSEVGLDKSSKVS